MTETAQEKPTENGRGAGSTAGRVDTHFAGNTRIGHIVYAAARFVVCGLTQLYTRMSIRGREHLPESGAYVIAPVHRSYIDTPIAACVTRRRVRFMAKDTMWKTRWFGRLISTMGAFPVHRGTVDREAFKRAISVLEDGEPLVLFPEGERKDGPTIQPLFDGAAFVAARAGVPIVPVGIGGSARVLPRSAKMLYPRKVHVVIGPAITIPADPSGRAARVDITAASASLRDELQRLFDEAQSRVG
ncbi:MAG: lysophospholipid acyltransferase family protein [Acidimicrobiia bacterium]|nr:lysophospholipid acyltransferase family protein [Acidimicrobiia bacterium]